MISMNPPFKEQWIRTTCMICCNRHHQERTAFCASHLRALDMGGAARYRAGWGAVSSAGRARGAAPKTGGREPPGWCDLHAGRSFQTLRGVSTAVLFTRGAKTENIWFYDMSADGFSLDDKRLPESEKRYPGYFELLEEPNLIPNSRKLGRNGSLN